MATSYEKIETETVGGLRINGWEITSCHMPILSNTTIEQYAQELGFNIPEMIFGNNYLCVHHLESGNKIKLTALDALRLVDTSPHSAKSVQVSIAENWTESSKRNRSDITDVIKPFDWTFTTKYRGTVTGKWEFAKADKGIDYEKLKARESILFYDENVLYEDDLGDNGTSQLSYKIRIMPSGFFVLQRFFLRVDGVLFRILDTRIYHAFDTDVVLREFSTREEPFDAIKRQVPKKKHDDEDLSLLNNIPFVDSAMTGSPVAECEYACISAQHASDQL
ncbi:Tap42 interacting protein [Coemansia spiralis]|uniref:Tap42 interacting protein n=2 Tax=Coemansia TaxID=4863 RepID=A0A9W8G5T8_9FUNG|nr:TIP41-like family-domain-containing protein [Coemansia spiralis]KAJ1993223.1 Tap42 interacting protein [Coemansia umbellata]KAJ2622481.1 Tap42 interacting protein [Coemansia sp. RSA 1358]KAJ2676002.1 Tap42 interacting protein [Coemansia spiralis]